MSVILWGSIFLTQLFPVPIAPKVKAYGFTAPLLAAALLLPPGNVALIAGTSFFLSDLVLRRPWFNGLFSGASGILYAGLASLCFRNLTSSFSSPKALPALLAAISLIVGANRLLVGGAASIQLGIGLGKILLRNWKEDLRYEGAFVSLGLLMALAAREALWSLALFPFLFFLLLSAFGKVIRQMEELRELQAKLVESAKLASVGTLAAGVAHQINNPIFVILGRAESLLANAAEHLRSEKARRSLQVIYEMALRIREITTSLLSFSRDRINFVPVDLNEVIEKALLLAGSKIKSSGIEVVRDLQPDLPPIYGNPAQLQELFLNLILNSCDAMPSGGTLTLSTRVENAAVKAEVRDTGKGIPEEIRSKIFDPFFTTKDPGKGFGLGLYVARNIVERHEGRILVESRPEEGTSFTVIFPAFLPASKEEIPSGV